MFCPDAEAIAAASTAAASPPPPAAPPPRPPSTAASLLARVPSQDTLVPTPILAVDLAALAAQIHPSYPVAALKNALLAASRPTGAAAAPATAATSHATGAAPELTITADSSLSTLHLAPSVPSDDAALAAGAAAAAAAAAATDSAADNYEEEGLSGGMSFSAVAIPVKRPEDEQPKPSSIPGGLFFDLEGHNAADDTSLPAGKTPLADLAASLTSVPGSLLQEAGATPAGWGPSAGEKDPLRDVSLGAVQLGSTFPGSVVREKGSGVGDDAPPPAITVELPSRAADVIAAEGDTTALIVPLPKKRASLGLNREGSHHLLVVTDDDGGDANVHHAATQARLEANGTATHPFPSTIAAAAAPVAARDRGSFGYGSIAKPPLPPPVVPERDTVTPTPVSDMIHGQGHPLISIDPELEVRGAAGSKERDLSLNVTYSVNWLGYCILLVAILSVASQGTAVKWLPDVAGATTATWLMQAQAVLMLPLAAAEISAMTRKQRATLLTDTTAARLMVAASLAQVAWASGFFVAVDYTSLVRAWVLNNSHAVLIVLLAAATKQALSPGEASGAAVAVAGILFMQVPVLFGRGLTPLLGDMVACASSIGAIAFLEICNRLRSRVPLFTMMLPVSAMNAVLFAVMAAVGQGGDFSVSDSGAFGWLAPHRLLFGLYLGGVVGLLGTVSCIAALSHLPSVVVSVAQTLMPPVGTSAAILLGVETIPDGFTTMGCMIMVGGVICIAQATASKEVRVDLNPRTSEV